MNAKLNPSMVHLSVGKNVLKEYNDALRNNVYMKDGDEFEIEIFNPLSSVIGVTIKICGVEDEAKRIIVRPGERVWIDRFLGTPQKFKFSTYEINGSDNDALEAIKNNGEIIVSVYELQSTNDWISTSTYTYTNTSTFTLSPFVYSDTTAQPSVEYTVVGGKILRSETSFQNTVNFLNNVSTSSTADFLKKTSTSSRSLSKGPYCAEASTISASSAIKTIETGIVEKGSESSTKFNSVSGYNFNLFPSLTKHFKIYPLSQKPVMSEDLHKRYCHNCGKKIKEKFKFCPFCGEKL